MESTIKDVVRDKYAEVARSVSKGKTSCCGPAESCCGPDVSTKDPITSDLYGTETAGLPEEAVLASLGCGNPTLLAQLHEGETVLDLGSGGGIDVLLSA